LQHRVEPWDDTLMRIWHSRELFVRMAWRRRMAA
jgi:hypothetical protein